MSKIQVEQKIYEMPPRDGITVAHFLTVADIERSVRFYETVFGGRILSRGDSKARPGTSRSQTRGSLSTSGRSDTRQTIGNAQRSRRPGSAQQLYEHPRCGYSSLL